MAIHATALALTPAGAAAPGGTRPAPAAAGFGDMLGQLIAGVEEKTADANTTVGNMINKTADVHDAMIALHEAETTLQLTVQIRNKLVNAYQEIMRMPI